jgi:hypothetical protein
MLPIKVAGKTHFFILNTMSFFKIERMLKFKFFLPSHCEEKIGDQECPSSFLYIQAGFKGPKRGNKMATWCKEEMWLLSQQSCFIRRETQIFFPKVWSTKRYAKPLTNKDRDDIA